MTDELAGTVYMHWIHVVAGVGSVLRQNALVWMFLRSCSGTVCSLPGGPECFYLLFVISEAEAYL